jgi:hypothetical protein
MIGYFASLIIGAKRRIVGKAFCKTLLLKGLCSGMNCGCHVKNGKERWKQEKKIQAQSENVCIDA